MVDQGLHEAAPAMRRQRRHVFEQPIVVAALHPAIGGVGAAPKYRCQFGPIQPRLVSRFLDRRPRGGTGPGRGQGAECGRRLSFDLGNDELRSVPPRLPLCGSDPLHKSKALRFGPVQRDVEPAARQGTALRRQDVAGDESGIVRACGSPVTTIPCRTHAFFSATRNSASVFDFTSSSVTPSASSISAMPSLPCLSMVKTARSVTTRSTTRSPVSGRLHFLRSFGPSLAECSITTTTRLTPATRSIAPPMPLTILPGIIQLARSPFCATCIAPRIDRSICPPRTMPKDSADEK